MSARASKKMLVAARADKFPMRRPRSEGGERPPEYKPKYEYEYEFEYNHKSIRITVSIAMGISVSANISASRGTSRSTSRSMSRSASGAPRLPHPPPPSPTAHDPRTLEVAYSYRTTLLVCFWLCSYFYTSTHTHTSLQVVVVYAELAPSNPSDDSLGGMGGVHHAASGVTLRLKSFRCHAAKQ